MITAYEARRLVNGKQELGEISEAIRVAASKGLTSVTYTDIDYENQLTLVDKGFEVKTVYDCGHISGYVISWE